MTFKSKSFPKEEFTFITPTWSCLNNTAFELAQKILKLDQKFDRIVTLAKGGWPMTRTMVDLLGIDQVASIGVKFYEGVHQRFEHPKIYQDLPVSLEGETVLLFDDVVDTGGSLEFVINHLKELGAKKIVTATLFYKPRSKFKPDFYEAETSDWIIFPYEAVETIRVFGKKWSKQGISELEIRDRLVKLSIDPKWIDYYLVK